MDDGDDGDDGNDGDDGKCHHRLASMLSEYPGPYINVNITIGLFKIYLANVFVIIVTKKHYTVHFQHWHTKLGWNHLYICDIYYFLLLF